MHLPKHKTKRKINQKFTHWKKKRELIFLARFAVISTEMTS